MKYTLLLLFCWSITCLQAQNDNVAWAAKPMFSTILDENKNENVIGIFLSEKVDCHYNSEGSLEMIHTLHKKFRLNNDEAINQFNKLSVSLNDVIEVIDIKARAIKSNGKVIEFDKNNIKEIKDEDSGKSYKIFAIDGIEKGDDVEYYVVRKMQSSNFGRTVFQFTYPLQEASFEIISPKNLIYDVKGYNGFPNGQFSSLDDERNQVMCHKQNITAIKDDKFSYLTPRMERIEYRLDYNIDRSKSQSLTWDDAAISVYESMYLNVDSKIMDQWMALAAVTGSGELEKIRQVEQFVKSNIYVEKFNAPEFSDLNFVYDNKVTGSRGIVKLYANIFKQLGIEHQLVLTSERDNIKFDGDFQTWNYLDEYLIYFPAIDTYLDPSIHAYRLGVVNAMLTATEGLFVIPVKIDDFEAAIGKVKYIPALPYSFNYDNMVIELSIDVDENTTRIVTDRGLNGLSGGYIRNFYKMMDAEQKLNTLKDLTSTKAPNPNYHTLEVREGSEYEAIKDAEFIIYSDITTDAFLENAGNKLLLSIGQSIGPQMEMYFEENRTAQAENDWNRMYHREIIFHVPDGYSVVNPEVAKMNIVEGDVYGFESDFTYTDGVYKIIIDEYYKHIMVKPEEFDGFKNVINAAADFNKVVLVLQEE
jgi:hypothetical protein